MRGDYTEVFFVDVNEQFFPWIAVVADEGFAIVMHSDCCLVVVSCGAKVERLGAMKWH